MKLILSFLFVLVLVLPLTGSVEARPLSDLSDGLIAYWHLDETSGDRIDTVGLNCGGDCDLPVNGTVGSDNGMSGNAATFNGTDGGALMRVDDTYLDTSNSSFTLAGWVYANSLPPPYGPTVIAAIGDSDPSYEFFIGMDTSGFIHFAVSDSEMSTELVSDIALEAEQWAWVAVWHDATNHRLGLQVNNSLAETSWDGSIEDLTGIPFCLGSACSNYVWDGRLDEFGLWSRALTSPDREMLFSNGGDCVFPFSNCQSANSSSVPNLAAGFIAFQSSFSQMFNNLWPLAVFMIAIAIIQVLIVLISLAFFNFRRLRR